MEASDLYGSSGGYVMSEEWKAFAVMLFVGGVVVAGLYLGACGLFVLTGN